MNNYERSRSDRKFETIKDLCDPRSTICSDSFPGYICSCKRGYYRMSYSKATKYYCNPIPCADGREFYEEPTYGVCKDIDECSAGLHSKYIKILTKVTSRDSRAVPARTSFIALFENAMPILQPVVILIAAMNVIVKTHL